MITMGPELLTEVGLGELTPEQGNSLLRHAYEALEMRVGIRLADRMTDAQLGEFEEFFEQRDDAGAFRWLETNFPDYKDIVTVEFEQLKRELALKRDVVLAAARSSLASL